MFGSRPSSVNRGASSVSTPGQKVISARLRPGAWARGWDRLLAATLLPPTCTLCGAQDLSGPADLCGHCAEALPRLRNACLRCALPSGAFLEAGTASLCPRCRRRPPEFDTALVPFEYAWPVDRLVRGLKFHGRRPFARVLGMELAAARQALGPPWPECVVPLPLHPRRFRERGFNQAEEIARYAARTLGLPLGARVLERALPTREQTGLSAAERRRNVRHAFRVRRPLSGQRVALIDDVLTTGSTAMEAARALKAGGACTVELWAAARTVLPPADGAAQECSEYSRTRPAKIARPT